MELKKREIHKKYKQQRGFITNKKRNRKFAEYSLHRVAISLLREKEKRKIYVDSLREKNEGGRNKVRIKEREREKQVQKLAIRM